MKPHRRNFAWGAGLVVLIFIAYRPALSNGWIWDDDHYIYENTALRTTDGLKRIWTVPTASPQYYPLTLSSFWLEEHLFGESPAVFHRDNILLHACSAIFLWMILRQLAVPAPWLIAAIWAVHPINVESVAWASERKNVLLTFFYLLAAMAYLPWVFGSLSPRPVLRERVRVRAFSQWRYCLALILFVLAMFSKTVAVTFPGAILLLTWWKRGKIGVRDVLRAMPFVAVGLPMSLLTSHLERTFVGARGPEFAFTWIQRCEIAAHDAWFYVAKVLWPTDLSFIYWRWPLSNTQLIYVAALIVVLLGLWLLRKKFGRGVMVGPLFFLGTLMPALGFVNVYPMRFSFVADHFQYLASVGMIAFVVTAIHRTGRWTNQAIGRIAADAVLATLMLLTFHRCGAFADSVTLWSDATSKNPDSWIVHGNLGAAYLDRGEAELNAHEIEAAARNFSAAQIQLEQAHAIRGDLVEPLTNLARIEELEGHFDAAQRWLTQALAINPNVADVHFHLGAVLVKAGKIDQGISEYSRAILLDKKHVPAWVNLGVALDMQGKTQQAADAYAQALTIDPDSILARVDLGNAYLKLHRPAEAAEQFRRALEIEPGMPEAIVGLRAAEGH